MTSNFYFFVIFRLNLDCYEKKLFPFNFKFRTKYYKVFRQASKYRWTKKTKHSTSNTGFEHTHTSVCDVEGLPFTPYGLITKYALDRLDDIPFHYFHPLTCPELTKVPLRPSSVQ